MAYLRVLLTRRRTTALDRQCTRTHMCFRVSDRHIGSCWRVKASLFCIPEIFEVNLVFSVHSFIAAEPWWIDTLSMSPILAPYLAETKKLDCLYLDTTFASLNKFPRDFPPRVFPVRTNDILICLKADSIQQLIVSMQKYPQSTIFHFNSWTFGYNSLFIVDLVSYEDIWMAVAAAFDCKARFASLCF
jgi:hypothetical protein